MHRPRRALRDHKCPALRTGIVVLTGAFAATVFPATATADATDDYPIPHRMIVTTCTAEQILTNFADPMTASWPNWAKIFFNNKGVAAKETDNCATYPPDDQSVWDG